MTTYFPWLDNKSLSNIRCSGVKQPTLPNSPGWSLLLGLYPNVPQRVPEIGLCTWIWKTGLLHEHPNTTRQLPATSAERLQLDTTWHHGLPSELETVQLLCDTTPRQIQRANKPGFFSLKVDCFAPMLGTFLRFMMLSAPTTSRTCGLNGEKISLSRR